MCCFVAASCIRSFLSELRIRLFTCTVKKADNDDAAERCSDLASRGKDLMDGAPRSGAVSLPERRDPRRSISSEPRYRPPPAQATLYATARQPHELSSFSLHFPQSPPRCSPASSSSTRRGRTSSSARSAVTAARASRTSSASRSSPTPRCAPRS